jgi:hypothetical protein
MAESLGFACGGRADDDKAECDKVARENHSKDAGIKPCAS